ncbi:MAG TPA: hypothetical protein PKC30_11590 [Saprospiraceae bacterium]|nr:hypothetical protein [Saprospiraceae bacterium]
MLRLQQAHPLAGTIKEITILPEVCLVSYNNSTYSRKARLQELRFGQ